MPRLSPSLLLFAGAVLGCDSATGPKTGSLTVNIIGLPPEATPQITITSGTTVRNVSGSQTLAGLAPGKYQISAANATSEYSTYAPTGFTSSIDIPAGTTPAVATINYGVISGIASIVVSGVPVASTPAIHITSSSGFSKTITGSTALGHLMPGIYAINAINLSADEIYAATVNPTSFVITPSTTPVNAVIAYTPVTGSISVTPFGLPLGVQAIWDVSGPSGYSRSLTGVTPQLLSQVPPGSYTVSARVLSHQGASYSAATPAISTSVLPGRTSSLSFTYATRPPTFDMSIDGLYLNQSVQRYDGAIPLVAGRPALVRVFVRASEPNSATPKVRIRLVRGGQVVHTEVISAPRVGVVTQINEANPSDSWNVMINASQVLPGTSILADVDPDNVIAETNEANNQFPQTGTPRTLSVIEMPPLHLRFVPIFTAANGLTGNASPARVNELADMTYRLHPIGTITYDFRPTVTTHAPLLHPDNANNSWSQVINELDAIRVAEGSSRHYVGVVRVPYGGGITGVGRVGGLSSVNTDNAEASATIAHELGHNFNRLHAPCGSVANPDPFFPHTGAATGFHGFDILAQAHKPPWLKDFMSYCEPAWTSDHTYINVMAFRLGVFAQAKEMGDPGHSLVIWGRRDRNELVLEPSFVVKAPSQLPQKGGAYRLRGMDSAGKSLFSLSFDAATTGEGRDSEQFAFSVPVTDEVQARLHSIILEGRGRSVQVKAAGSPGGFSVSATRLSPNEIDIRWNATAHPMIVVKDPATGQILSFARGGRSVIRASHRSLDVMATDNIKSVRATIQVRD